MFETRIILPIVNETKKYELETLNQNVFNYIVYSKHWIYKKLSIGNIVFEYIFTYLHLTMMKNKTNKH